MYKLMQSGMNRDKPLVVLGLLGPTLDSGRDHERWDRWRPTVAVCQHEDLLVDRFELLCQPEFRKVLDQVVDDLGAVSPETEVRTHELPLTDPWDFEEVFGALHDFAREYPFDPDAERYAVHITTGTHVAQISLFLLTEARYFPATLLQTSPPRRRERGSPGTYREIDLDLSRYDRIATRFAQEQMEGLSFLKSGIETRNEAFNTLIERIERVAIASSAPILLTGPTGAGKSQLARRIFELKKARRQVRGDFVEVNCATLRGDGAMSALFGHVKGAFTGAVGTRQGLLRTAHEGVLFLDEIAELGPDEQAMLLRGVEEGRFLPVGSDREAESRFQLIAGTNRDLQEEVRAGRFRDDLLARIDLWTFRLPGLRDRIEDLEPNLAYELDQFAARTGDRATFNREARERFLRFATSSEARWSANFRDLNAAVTRMATLAHGGRITKDVVDEEIDRLREWWHPESGSASVLSVLLTEAQVEAIDPFDRVQLEEVVAVCRRSASLSAAGRMLFAASRRRKKSSNDADRLSKYLARYGLDWSSVISAGKS